MEGQKQIVEALSALREDLAERHRENVTSLGVTEKKLDEVIRRVDDLHNAFPGGDPDGHRRYHESLIEKAEARTKFYNELRVTLAKNGLWALLVLLGVALWSYVKSKVIA